MRTWVSSAAQSCRRVRAGRLRWRVGWGLRVFGAVWALTAESAIGRAFSPRSSGDTIHGVSPHAGIGRAVGAERPLAWADVALNEAVVSIVGDSSSERAARTDCWTAC